MNKTVVFLVVLVVILVGVWYFSQAERDLPGELPIVKEFTIEGLDDFSFSPNEISVNEGDTVRIRFVNSGEMPHDLVINELGVATDVLQGGEEEVIEFVADRAGTFEFHCSVGQHREFGMFGTLIVGDEAEEVREEEMTEGEAMEETEESAEEEALEGDEASVSYANAGFSPGVVTVPSGTTVVFENNSSRNMWVASDPHPVHSDLPEFDSRRGVGPGESYEFTFTRVGSWGYHDHLNPQHGGTVIVE